MGHTKDFFIKKKSWSGLKDQILDYYLTPYIAKILKTGKPLVIVDCFAGKGKFDDGELGSPLIIARHITSILDDHTRRNREISAVLIEKKYYDDLANNVSAYRNCTVWAGTFEDHLTRIIQLNPSNNLFVYIDPYGIKCLDFNRFADIKKNNFYTLELLLNFNSVGFLREGLRLLKFDNHGLEEEDGEDYELDETNNLANMTRIANGDYWIELAGAIRDNKLTMYEAEQIFIKQYTAQIQSLFKYVLTIPIKQKTRNVPKYRLIFGTNNQEGLLLMADSMHKRWQKIIEEQRGSQMVLFDDYEFPDLSLIDVNEFDLKEEIINALKDAGGTLLLKDLIVNLILKLGVTFSESYYKKYIKSMPLVIKRVPEKTPRGKKSESMDYNEYDIWISV